jgi:dihydrofolate synthase / folylpolyglutamate synthase
MRNIEPNIYSITEWLTQSAPYVPDPSRYQFDVGPVRRFLEYLDWRPAPITVAGTKGKGSTAALVEAGLVSARRRTVTFASPEVVTIQERWRIDGEPAAARELADACNEIQRLDPDVHRTLSEFELSFVIACVLAIKHASSEFICEVGLGGRRDAANALDCRIAVLTHLSHDHRNWLGPTLVDIAREKVCIARAGRPLFIAPQSPTAEAAVRQALTELRHRPDVRWVQRLETLIDLTLLGDHQQDNAATALAVLRELDAKVDDASWLSGMATARLPGRCQLVPYRGVVAMVDGAHNGPSVEATLMTATTRLRAPWALIIGVAADKEIEEIVQAVEKFPDMRVLRCGRSEGHRRFLAEDGWPKLARRWPWFENVWEAIDNVPKGSDFCVTGSLFLAGDVLRVLGRSF